MNKVFPFVLRFGLFFVVILGGFPSIVIRVCVLVTDREYFGETFFDFAI
jgi:hypothetical protein